MKVARGAPRPQPGTLTQLFYEAAERYDKPDALQVKIGGRYEPISHRTLVERVRHVGRGLQRLGIRPGDHVAIISENRPEWAIADYACLTARLVDVAIYTTLAPQQIAYILNDSGAVAAFVSTRELARKIAQVRHTIPALKCVIGFDDIPEDVDLTFAELERRGREGETPESAAQYKQEALQVRPEDLATLLYTSGTTGEPKGVMLTHDNLYSNVAAGLHIIPFSGHDVGLSFLPLSHIFERMAGHYLMYMTGTSIAYAESMDTVPDNLLEVRPTFLVSVPRIYEKIYARVMDMVRAGSPAKQAIFRWARGVADQAADERVAGREPGGWLGVKYAVAHKLVFAKILARTGGRIRYCVSGGAPLSPELNKFFYGIGLFVLEGYGLTETSPVISVNTPEAFRFGTVGRPFGGVEVKIADDGEILTRGPHVMKGYYNLPEATAQAIDADGWFHTGDIGELEDGFLKITDRKKELIVTSGGKNIAPQPIENRIRQNRYVTNVAMIGDKRNFPAVLVVPNFEQLEGWAKFKHIEWRDRSQLLTLPAVQEKMEREVLEPLSDLAHFERPKKVALIENDFTIDRDEITPSLKLKRRVINEHYKDVIDELYAEGRKGEPVAAQ